MVDLVEFYFNLLIFIKIQVGGNIHEEQISTIADHTIGELVKYEFCFCFGETKKSIFQDSDGDLTITFDEFCQTLSKIDIDEKMSMKFWKS